MSNELIAAVERVVTSVAQEFEKDASVMVQFAAGEWHALKEALAKAKAPATTDAGSEPTPVEATDSPQSEANPSSLGSEPATSYEAPESFLPPGV